jgi:hypothetical protein
LTFYQELIANEGYLRTATERRSILELARLVGYSLRPGVAATVYLAYTLDDKQTDPVEIPIGSRSQSIPGPGDQPQSFETIEKVVARQEWSNLQVRLTRPQRITLDNVLSLPTLFAAGVSTNLKAGDLLLFSFGDPAQPIHVVRKAAEVNAVFADSRTEITLEPLEAAAVAALPALATFINDVMPQANVQGAAQRMVDEAKRILEQTRLGLGPLAEKWIDTLSGVADGVPDSVTGSLGSRPLRWRRRIRASSSPHCSRTPPPKPAAAPTCRAASESPSSEDRMPIPRFSSTWLRACARPTTPLGRTPTSPFRRGAETAAPVAARVPPRSSRLRCSPCRCGG